MPLQNYFEPFYIQTWATVDDGFGGMVKELTDGFRVFGVLSKAAQAEIRIAEAQGLRAQYNFVTDINLTIVVNDVLRRKQNGDLFRVTGLPEHSPGPAVSKFQLLPVELVTRDSVTGGGL